MAQHIFIYTHIDITKSTWDTHTYIYICISISLSLAIDVWGSLGPGPPQDAGDQYHQVDSAIYIYTYLYIFITKAKT